MNKDPLFYIKHIGEAINAIESFLQEIGNNKDQFLESLLYQSAVTRQLEIIGEAAKNVPTEFRRKYSTIPWSQIAGLRDKITHHYFGIQLERVWNVVEKDLPLLKEQIHHILINEENK